MHFYNILISLTPGFTASEFMLEVRMQQKSIQTLKSEEVPKTGLQQSSFGFFFWADYA